MISEIKRASPSAGFIRDADPSEWGARYELEGAHCLSVLTEPERFQGSLEDLDAARNATTLPVLRKDFTVDEAQILETGTRADAVLLIAALFEAAARPLRLPGRRGRPDAARGDPRRRGSEPGPRIRRQGHRRQQPGSQGLHRTSAPSNASRRNSPARSSSPRVASRTPKTPEGYETQAPTRSW